MPINTVEVLLVEDNPSDVQLTQHVFKKHHISNNIHIVRDGAEALEYIFCTGRYSERRFDYQPRVIILDLKLPLVSGLDVIHQIKDDPKTRCIPVVVLTSSREETDIADCFRLGVNSYVVKPVDFEEFTETVKNLGRYWLQNNQSIQPQSA